MTLMITVAICSLSLILTPEGDRGIGGYTRLVASLCVLSVAISPVASFVESLYELEIDGFFLSESANRETFEEIYFDSLLDANEKDISGRIEELICGNFNIREGDISVFAELYLNGEECEVRCVSVLLSSGAIAKNPHEIKEYVENLLACECEIVYA